MVVAKMKKASLVIVLSFCLMGVLGKNNLILADTNNATTEGAVSNQATSSSPTTTTTTTVSNLGGIPIVWLIAPQPPKGGFKLLISNGAKQTNSSIVNLTIVAMPDTKRMVISNFSDFKDASQQPYKGKVRWNLCTGLDSCKEGQHFIYVKLYTPWGVPSKILSANIVYRESARDTIIVKIQTQIRQISKKISNLGKEIVRLFREDKSVGKNSQKIIQKDYSIQKESPTKKFSEVTLTPPKQEGDHQNEETLSHKKRINVFNLLGRKTSKFWQDFLSLWQAAIIFLFKP